MSLKIIMTILGIKEKNSILQEMISFYFPDNYPTNAISFPHGMVKSMFIE